MDYKYIAFHTESVEGKKESFYVIFDEVMRHDQVHNHMSGILGLNKSDIVSVSAGMINWNPTAENYETYGFSMDLGLGSDKQDGENLLKVLKEQKHFFYHQDKLNHLRKYIVSSFVPNHELVIVSTQIRYNNWVVGSVSRPFHQPGLVSIPSDVSPIERLINTRQY